jgi:uncharacterized protein YvpB
MENKTNKTSKTHKKLGIALLISIICLAGISVYATHWEEIAAIDWKQKWEQWQAQRQEQKQEQAQEERTFECRITGMSRHFPALMKVADTQDSLLAVPLISQQESGYQTGCELVSAAMVLNYYGIEVTPQDVYTVIDKPEADGAVGTEGATPDKYFIGDPTSTHGYGCYVAPLVEAMNRLFGEEWNAVNVSDFDLDDLEKNYLEQGIPVIIWATINMSEPQNGASWTAEDGTSFQWIAGEHCLVLVGADEQYYYFNDPNHEGEVIGYEKDVVRERYEQLGKQAIIVSR